MTVPPAPRWAPPAPSAPPTGPPTPYGQPGQYGPLGQDGPPGPYGPPGWGQPMQPWGGQPYPGIPQGEPVHVRHEVAGGLVTGLVLLLVGAPLGLLWEALAPTPDYAGMLTGAESAYRGILDVDLVLAGIVAAVGVLAALAVRRPARRSSVGVPLGLVVGMFLCGLVASRTGSLSHPARVYDADVARAYATIPGARPYAQAQTSVHEFLSTYGAAGFRLRSRALLLVGPLSAVLTFLALRYFDRTGPRPAPPVSSGSSRLGPAPEPASR